MRYYIIAGEASGDLHGALLVREIKALDKDATFRYWGGDKMMAQIGHPPVKHIKDLAIMGFVEVLLHLRTVLGNISFCKKDISAFNPDVVIGIDYPGFNLKIEKWGHNHGFKTIHYISPNLWAWKKGRIKGMKKNLDALCYILPFEQTFFAQNNMSQAFYVGHPLLDAVNQQLHDSDNGLQEPLFSADNSDKRPIIALLPGSRKQELKKNMPLMIRLANNHREYRFIVAGMKIIGDSLYKSMISADSNVEVVYDKTYALLENSFAAVVCSGTATLETALFDVPQVVCYRANAISIAIAKALVGRRVNHIALVDLIVDADVVVELLQQDYNLERLEKEFYAITLDEDNRERILNQYADMRSLLGDGGAAHRAAETIIQVCK